jgi:hypothetical protein
MAEPTNDHDEVCGDSLLLTSQLSRAALAQEGYKLGLHEPGPPFIDEISHSPPWNLVRGVELTKAESDHVVADAGAQTYAKAIAVTAREIQDRLKEQLQCSHQSEAQQHEDDGDEITVFYIAGMRLGHYLHMLQRISHDILKRLRVADIPAEDGSEAAPTETTYRVTDRDVREIVDHVLRITQGLRNAEAASLGSPRKALKSANRASPTNRAVTIPRSGPASPAMTFTLPKVSSAGQASKNEDSGESFIIATYISRQSVTEVQWPSPESSGVSPAQVNEENQDGKGKARAAAENALVLDTDQLHQEPNTEGSDPKTGRSTISPHHVSPLRSAEGRMISFPALGKRRCTNDWISPPIGSLDDGASALYEAGVDAHLAGRIPSIPTLPEPPLYPAPIDLSFFREPGFRRYSSPDKRPLKPQILDRSVACNQPPRKQLGTSLGISSGRRRSAHGGLESMSSAIPIPSLSPSTALAKLRSGSHSFSHTLGNFAGSRRHSVQNPQIDPYATAGGCWTNPAVSSAQHLFHVPGSWKSNHQTHEDELAGTSQQWRQSMSVVDSNRKSLSLGKMREILAKVPFLQRPDVAKGYETITALEQDDWVQASRLRGRRSTCVEDGRLHLCQDELEDEEDGYLLSMPYLRLG